MVLTCLVRFPPTPPTLYPKKYNKEKKRDANENAIQIYRGLMDCYRWAKYIVTVDDQVKAYIKRIMVQLNKWMTGGKISKLVIVITSKETGENVERWQFDVCFLSCLLFLLFFPLFETFLKFYFIFFYKPLGERIFLSIHHLYL